jgi:hypothetical protein
VRTQVCARTRPRLDLGARPVLDHEVEGARGFGPQTTQLIRQRRQRVWTGQVDGEQTIPTSGAPDRPAIRPAGGDPHRDPRPLKRTRLKFTIPKAAQPLQSLVEQPRPFAPAEDLPERFQLAVAVAAEPDPERQATVTEVVQRDRLARQLVNAAARQRRDHRPDPQRVGGAGDSGQRHPGIRDRTHGRPIRDVIPEKEAVPAPGLCTACQFAEQPRIYQLVERRKKDAALDAHDPTLQNGGELTRPIGGPTIACDP